MSYPQTALPLALGVPVKGMNRRDPLAKMDPSYATWALNMEPEAQYLRVRNGWHLHARLTEEQGIDALGVYKDSALFAYAQGAAPAVNHIYNVTAAGNQAAAAAVHNCTGASGAGELARAVHYAGRLAFMSLANFATLDRVYDGSSWAATGWTYAAAAIGGRVVKSYKGRVYIAGSVTAPLVYYSETVGAVTGATLLWDLSTIFEFGGQIIWMDVLSSAGNRPDESFLAVGNEKGEILVYAGDNPSATNWEMIGRFNSGAPLFYNCALAYQSDVFVLTEIGVVSLRQLFTAKDDGDPDVTISKPINPYFTALVRGLKTSSGFLATYAGITFWPDKNKIYINCQGVVSVSGVYSLGATINHTIFTYNFISKAWAVHQVDSGAASELSGVVYFNGNLYRAVGTYVLKYNLSSYKDEVLSSLGTYKAIPYALHSAYFNLGTGQTKRVSGWEPLINTDFSGADVTMKTATDFGRKVSSASTNALLAAGGYQAPTYSVGGEGSYFQYRLEGNSTQTATTGLELYSVGAIVV
jgi:hypothetical protein